MIKHLVLIRWKESASAQARQDAIAATQSLRGIEGVIAVSTHENLGLAIPAYGKNISHLLVVLLADLDALKRYGPHPLHIAVANLLLPAADDLTIFDHDWEAGEMNAGGDVP